ncbi:hypothetical protein [Burkholderia seminalis]|uniref:hypothetical protein n=1 Tax=Burkholderia seminalis TaxID=488731 RepID=UPI000F5B7C0A|nr:hypothetical protein [Burkholderia seminalis]
MNPQIVILSHREDEHALAALSAFSANVTPFLLDIGRAGIDFMATSHGDGTLELNTRGGQRIIFSKAAFWWNRRPRVNHCAGADYHYRAVQEAEYEAFWKGVFRHGAGGHWCNPFDNQVAAQDKIYQFHAASSIGLKVPDTMWTNCPQEVEAFLNKHNGRVIFKMFSGTKSVWQPCRKFDDKFTPSVNYVQFMPAIYQEYIAGDFEHRVTIFGEHCFAATANLSESRYPADVRIDLRLRRRKGCIDKLIEKRLREFMGRFGLSFATFDLREREDGEVIFLECNPMGQFLYLDNLYQGEMLRKFCEFAESHVSNHMSEPSYDGQKNEAAVHDPIESIRVPIYEAANSWLTHMN